MSSVRILETLIFHGSDFVVFYEGSGYSAVAHRPPIDNFLGNALDNVLDNAFDITVVSAPRDLVLHKRNHRLVFDRKQPNELHSIVPGLATAAQKIAPVEATYTVSARLIDKQRIFNPRLLTVNAGNGAGLFVPLYRSPFGTHIPEAGALRCNLVYASGEPASWAIATLAVTPTVGSAVVFVAQANRHGDMVIMMNRLPALNRNAPSSTYAAILSVRASGNADTEIEDPVDAVPFNIGDISLASTFVSSTRFNVTPGAVTTVVSQGEPNLVLQAIP